MEQVTQEADHVLVKRGLYYRPNGNGYTGLKSEAGLYPASYALGLDGVQAIPFADAPEFAPACWEETKLAHLRDQLATARAEVEALKATLGERNSQLHVALALLQERADALALQAAEREGKYAVVSEMNAALAERVKVLDKALRGYPVPEDYENLTNFQMAYLNWRKLARAALADTRQQEAGCRSCGGLNLSCPDGCGRDPATGELNGTRQQEAG